MQSIFSAASRRTIASGAGEIGGVATVGQKWIGLTRPHCRRRVTSMGIDWCAQLHFGQPSRQRRCCERGYHGDGGLGWCKEVP
jgi:hypothetical protein